MSMQIQCPSCSESCVVADVVVGDFVSCSHCGEPITVVDIPRDPAHDETVDYPIATPDDDATDAALSATVLTGAESPAASAASAEEHSSGIARKFGDYELLDEIARGGMGVVYRARQTRLNRVVALKMILSGQLASDSDVQRFYTEAEAAAGLDHHGIVPIFEVGEYEGQHFFSMGFVEGCSLSERVAGGPLPGNECARLTKLTAEAIAYAHQQGVIHRDLKPANILLDRDGQPRVTDFGLAKKFNEDSGLTASGQILGTPGYMPPEQAGGDIDNVGPSADVYSLGAILYCLMTGRPPFQSASIVDTLMQVREQEPVAPRQLNPDIDVDLETICLKCLAKEPAGRYPDAQTLVDELDRFLVGVPIQARPVGRLARVWRWCKRKPLVAALTAAVATLILFVSIAAPIVAFQQAGLKEEADDNAETALELQGVAEANERIARQRADSEARAKAAAEKAGAELADEKERALANLYGTTIALAYREWQENNIARADQLLTETPAKFRHWEWFYLKSLCHTERYNFSGHSEQIVAAQFSRDSRYLATLSSDQTIRIWGIRSGAAVASHDIGNAVVALGPAGERFAAVDSKGIRICDLVSGAVHSRLASPSGLQGRVRSVALSFDGSRVAMFVTPRQPGRTNELHILDVASGNVVSTISGLGTVNIPVITFSRDGSRIASTGNHRSTAAIWDVTTGERLHALVGHVIPISNCQFSPDGAMLATSSLGGVVKLWDTETGRELHSLHGHVDFVTGLDFSENGRWLASCGKDRSVRIWDPHAGLEVLTLRGNTHYVMAVTVSANGKWVATGCTDRTAKVWDIERLLRVEAGVPKELTDHFFSMSSVENDQQRQAMTRGLHGMHYKHVSLRYRSFFGHVGPVTGVGFTDNGETFASASHDDQVRFVESSNGDLVRSAKHEKQISDLSVSVAGNLTVAALEARGADSVKVWYSDTGQEKLSLEGPAPRTARVAVSHDGRMIAAGADGAAVGKPVEVKLWDSESGNLLHTLNGHTMQVTDVVFSPDGKVLLSSGRDGMRLWNTATGEQLWRAEVYSVSAAIHPDGTIVATAHADGRVRLWDMQTGERVGEMDGPRVFLSSIAWTPDGKRIITGSDNATIGVWDPQTRLKLLTLRGHTHQVTQVVVSEDGRRIASASQDGSVNIWDAGEASVEADSSNWPVVFDGTTVSGDDTEQWTVQHGDWNAADGSVRATLRPTELPGGIKFNGVTALLSDVTLPDEVELTCNVVCEGPAAWQVGLVGPEGHAVMIELAGVENPMLLTKGAILWVMNGPGKFSQPMINRQFEFLPDETYRVRFIRQKDNVRVVVNDADLFSSKLNLESTPTLIMQCAYGAAGTTFRVTDLQARAPASAVRRGEARELLAALFDEWLVHEDVASQLEQDESLSEELRETAADLLETFALPPAAKLNAAAWQIVTDAAASAADYDRALRLAQAAVSQSFDDPDHLTTLGAAQYRTERFDAAAESLRKARDRFGERRGVTTPACLGFLCLAQRGSGSIPDASRTCTQLLDFSISHAWTDDPLNDRLLAEVRKAMSPVVPEQPDDNDVRQLKRLIIAGQQGSQARHDIDAGLADWAVDGSLTYGRTAHPDDTDVTFQGEHFRQYRALQFTGDPVANRSIWPGRVEVAIEGETAVGNATEVTVTGGNFDERQCLYEFRKVDGVWKIASQRIWKTRSRRNGRTVALNGEFFAKRDSEIEQFRVSGDQRELVSRLTGAGRGREAYEIVCQLTEQTPNVYQLWQLRSGTAAALGNVDDAVHSLRQLIRIAPRNLSLRQRLMIQLAATEREAEALKTLADRPSRALTDRYRRMVLARSYAGEMRRLRRFDADSSATWLTSQVDHGRTSVADSNADADAFNRWIGGEQTWHIVGPLDGGKDFEGFDRRTDLEDTPSLDTVLTSDSKELTWQAVRSQPGAFINLEQHIGKREQVIAYALAFVKVASEQNATVLFGSDDAGKVFLNGDQVHNQRVSRQFRTAADQFPITLKPGVNTLLVKISQNTGEWGFSFDLIDDRGVPLHVDWQ